MTLSVIIIILFFLLTEGIPKKRGSGAWKNPETTQDPGPYEDPGP